MRREIWMMIVRIEQMKFDLPVEYASDRPLREVATCCHCCSSGWFLI